MWLREVGRADGGLLERWRSNTHEQSVAGRASVTQLLPELSTVLRARDTSRLVARVLTARAATKILLQLQETDLFVHRWFGEFCMENPPNQVALLLLLVVSVACCGKFTITIMHLYSLIYT